MTLHSILEYDRQWPAQMLAYLSTKDSIPEHPAHPAPRFRDEHDQDLIDLWLLGHPVA